jgi:hypothetical protein
MTLLSPKLKLFVRAVVAGENPEKIVKKIYPDCPDADGRAALLLAKKSVQRAIHMLTDLTTGKDAIRIKLNAVINDPRSKPSDLNAALKLLAYLEGSLGTKTTALKHKKRIKAEELEDDQLHEKMAQLQKKVREKVITN